MLTSRLPLLALLLAVPAATAAPAPPAGRDAKVKLEALKKRLPGLVAAWEKEHPLGGVTGTDENLRECRYVYVTVPRRVRLIADREAKLTFHVRLKNAANGKLAASPRAILTVFLRYHDGLWTTVRSEWGGRSDKWWDSEAAFLLDAIDEAAEKK